ncbi:MAG TPA: hypothetical protein VIE68_01880 [Gemmatimonadota bacterium]|jgi:hypothetical protein
MKHVWEAILLAAAALTATAGAAGAQQPDRLAPLRFLLGEWHGEGQGSYGPYRYHVRYVERGGWIHSWNDIVPQGATEPLLKASAVLGVDAEGAIVNHVFDSSGHLVMSGRVEGDGLTFEWRESADSWRTARIERTNDGGLRFAGDVAVPGAGVQHFESEARPGPLPAGESEAP